MFASQWDKYGQPLFCDPHIINPFEGLHSKYLQQKYFQEKSRPCGNISLLKLNPCMTNYIIIGCCGKKTWTENGPHTSYCQTLFKAER